MPNDTNLPEIVESDKILVESFLGNIQQLKKRVERNLKLGWAAKSIWLSKRSVEHDLINESKGTGLGCNRPVKEKKSYVIIYVPDVN